MYFYSGYVILRLFIISINNYGFNFVFCGILEGIDFYFEKYFVVSLIFCDLLERKLII